MLFVIDADHTIINLLNVAQTIISLLLSEEVHTSALYRKFY
jgi:hypothetical protein